MKPFDLEKRTTEFAKAVLRLCKSLQRSPINDRLINQAIDASGSVGANYREANDPLGKKDLLQRMRIARIARREAKEAHHWLDLILEANPTKKSKVEPLLTEALELKNILSAIINKIQ